MIGMITFFLKTFMRLVTEVRRKSSICILLFFFFLNKEDVITVIKENYPKNLGYIG